MGIVLGPNQYGKAEVHVVRVVRDTPRHVIRDLEVSTLMRGDFKDAHTTGNQGHVLPTDTQKNTAFAFTKEPGVDSIESYALALGAHFLDTVDPVNGVCVGVEEFAWDRIQVGGVGHDHSFVRRGGETRNTAVTINDGPSGREAHVVSGLTGLVVLKSTGSEFKGFLKDKYTTLLEADDRVMSTALVARWRYTSTEVDWDAAYETVRATCLERWATTYSGALQQTLYAMGEGVLQARPDIAEIRFSAPNKHHFLVDLEPFGVANSGEVFYAADRPFGLIEASVLRDDVPAAPDAWYDIPEFA